MSSNKVRLKTDSTNKPQHNVKSQQTNKTPNNNTNAANKQNATKTTPTNNNTKSTAATSAAVKSAATPVRVPVIEVPQLTEAEKQLKQAQTTYTEQQKLLNERIQLRTDNLHAHTTRQQYSLSNLDSSIKRCTGFKNKIQNITQTPLDTLKKDVTELNLTKYIDEISIELSQLKLIKNSDIIKYIYVCSLLHQRYENFIQPLIQSLIKQFNTNTTPDELKNQKIVIRMYCELLYCGLTDNCGAVMQYIATLISHDTHNDSDSIVDDQFINLQLVMHFLKFAAEELLGIISTKMLNIYKLLSVEPLNKDGLKYGFVTEQQRFVWTNGITKYINLVQQRLNNLYKSMKRVDRRVQKQILLRGEPLSDVAAEHKQLHEIYDKLMPLVQQLCDTMNLEDSTANMIDDSENDELSSAAVVLASNDSTLNEHSMYIDQEEQQYYENLIDLRLRVPPLLLSDASDKDKRKLTYELKKQDSDPKDTTDTTDTVTDNDATTPTTEATDEQSIEQLDENVTVEQLESKLNKEVQFNTEQYETQNDTEQPTTTQVYTTDKVNTEKLAPIDLLCQELTTAITVDAINSIAEQFVYINTKNNRQKLVDTLYYVHWTNIDIVSNYARLVAILYPYIPEIGKQLIQLLQSEFYYLLKQKTQQRYETKIKNIRYIIELTKFHVCPPIVILTCIHASILQFSNYTVPVLATICEYCGYWLHKNPITTQKFNQYVDTIKRLKQQKFLDLETSLQLDNALNNILPQQNTTVNKLKERTVLHQYIRYLLYTLLTPRTTEQVLQHMRTLPWLTDESVKHNAIKCFANVYNIKYNYIACLASVLSGLDSYYNIGVYVVDAVLNELYVGQQHSDLNLQYQRQIVNIKYLGELYAYRLCDTQTIFDVLYTLITYDKSSETQPSSTHMIFNVRLVLTLLDVVSKYFDHGALKKRLERFLLYLQRYIYHINTLLPIEIEFGIVDLFTRVKPSTARYTSLNDVNNAIEKLESQPDITSHKDYKLYHVNDLLTQSTVSTVVDEYKAVESDEDERDDEHDSIDTDEHTKTTTDNTDNSSEISSEQLEHSDDDTSTSSSMSDSSDSEAEQFQRRRLHNKTDELDTLFDRMMTESVESRKYDRSSNINIVPSADIAVANLDTNTGVRNNNNNSNIQRVIDDDNEYVAFKLLQRNNKSTVKNTAKQLLIPMDTDIALNTINNEQYLRQEREQLKQLVMAGIHREAAEERDAELQRIQGRSAKRDNRVDLDFSHREYDPSTRNSGNTGSSRNSVKGPKLDLNDIGNAFPEFKSRRRKY